MESFNGFLKRIAKKVVSDLPQVLMALEKSFNDTNNILRDFVEKEKAQIMVVEVDDFYRNLPHVVSPVTIHPSSDGSQYMADLLESKLCDL